MRPKVLVWKLSMNLKLIEIKWIYSDEGILPILRCWDGIFGRVFQSKDFRHQGVYLCTLDQGERWVKISSRCIIRALYVQKLLFFKVREVLKFPHTGLKECLVYVQKLFSFVWRFLLLSYFDMIFRSVVSLVFWYDVS